MIEQRSQHMESSHWGTEATFAMGDFGFKNRLNTERPTSETIIFKEFDINKWKKKKKGSEKEHFSVLFNLKENLLSLLNPGLH